MFSSDRQVGGVAWELAMKNEKAVAEKKTEKRLVAAGNGNDCGLQFFPSFASLSSFSLARLKLPGKSDNSVGIRPRTEVALRLRRSLFFLTLCFFFLDHAGCT